MSDESKGDKVGDEVKQAQPPQADADKKNSNNPPVNHVVIPPTIPPNPQPAISDSATTTRGHKKKKCSFKCFKDWVEILGIIAGTAVLVILALQLKAMNKQTVAMQGQLNEMSRGTRLDERAWISPVHLQAAEGTNSITYQIQFKNSGRTPGLRLIIGFDVATNEDSLPEYSITAPTNYSYGFFPPNVDGYTERTHLKSELGDAWDQKRPVYIGGMMWYNDIFGTNHWTRFKWVLSPDGGTFPALSGNDCDTNQ